MKKLGTPINDNRINCQDYLIEMTIREYYGISQNILKNNEYQRRRVKSSSTVYSLLKEDLKQGCIMPPIVLAMSRLIGQEEDVIDVIQNHKDEIIILDGLQRSFTIRDIVRSLEETSMDISVLDNPIRVELYVGINKFGILYRMLTYNTGQTQMSTRHQIEIIYSDYLEKEKDGIKFYREIDDARLKNIGEYKFRDVVDGFTSYIDRDYLALERIDILNSIRSLQELTKEDPRAELFDVFIHIYHNMVKKIDESSENWTFNGEMSEVERPFAQNVISIFNKSQSLTGFGAAIGKLIDQNIYENLSDIFNRFGEKQLKNVYDGLDLFIQKMDFVRGNAKKIGNDQRLFFCYFYRGLFDKESESFMDLKKSVEYSFHHYERETM